MSSRMCRDVRVVALCCLVVVLATVVSAAGGVVAVDPLREVVGALHALRDHGTIKHMKRVFSFRSGSERGSALRFLGVNKEQVHHVAKKAIEEDAYTVLDAFQVMDSPYNEQRLLALLLLQHRFQEAGLALGRLDSRSTAAEGARKARATVVSEFIRRIPTHLNCWNLVDMGAPPILGGHISANPALHGPILFTLAKSENIWERRAAVLGTFPLVLSKDTELFERVAVLLMDDPEYYVQSAIGWALRELGMLDEQRMIDFFVKYAGRVSSRARMIGTKKLPREKWEELARLDREKLVSAGELARSSLS